MMDMHERRRLLGFGLILEERVCDRVHLHRRRHRNEREMQWCNDAMIDEWEWDLQCLGLGFPLNHPLFVIITKKHERD